jgi:hypothetical protein
MIILAVDNFHTLQVGERRNWILLRSINPSFSSMKKLCSFVVLSMLATTSMAQTQFWVDDFESASPSSGSRNPAFSVSCGGPPATAYFNRVGTANISTGTVYTGFQGSSFWAIEDIDKGPTCVNNSVTAHQNITWQGINIAGKLGLSFKGLFAVGTTTSFDGFGMVNSGGTSKYDYLIVQYRIDGGAWTDLLRFFPSINNAGNGTLAIETTGDSIAQGEGTSLTTVASEFSANIAGTGVTLELQIKTHSNSAAEEILLDNFRFFETVASPEINLQGNSNSIIDGDATPTSNGPYRLWQSVHLLRNDSQNVYHTEYRYGKSDAQHTSTFWYACSRLQCDGQSIQPGFSHRVQPPFRSPSILRHQELGVLRSR